MVHKLIFHIEASDKHQQWHNNVDKAFKEFFSAKDEEFDKQIERMAGDKEDWGSADSALAELGKGKENAFKASNGLKIYWEYPPIKND